MGIILRSEKSQCLKVTFMKLLTKLLCPEGLFFRVWVSKLHPDALLAKPKSSSISMSFFACSTLLVGVPVLNEQEWMKRANCLIDSCIVGKQ